MTRRLGLTLLAVLGLIFCGKTIPVPVPTPGAVTLWAQTVPVTVTALWNPNAGTENIVRYTVQLDTGPALPALPAVCTGAPVTCRLTVTVPSFGPHTVAVLAQNLKLSTDHTSLQSGLASTVAFTLNQSPATVTGLTVGP